MSTTKVTSILLGFIADCSVRLNKIGIHHLQISDGYLRAWDHHRKLYIEIDLAFPADCDVEVFQLSIETTPQNAKRLRAVGKRGGSIQVEMQDNGYLFRDDYSNVEIRKITSAPVTASIADFVTTLQKQGVSIPEITGRGELSLSGNEPYVLLGVYDSQLASLTIPNQQEQFFAQNVARQLRRQQRIIYKSYGFLKFGEPDFKVSLHKGHEGLWLLTQGQFADGIPFSVLERLTPVI